MDTIRYVINHLHPYRIWILRGIVYAVIWCCFLLLEGSITGQSLLVNIPLLGDPEAEPLGRSASDALWYWRTLMTCLLWGLFWLVRTSNSHAEPEKIDKSNASLRPIKRDEPSTGLNIHHMMPSTMRADPG
jgi:hypothetical protein